MTSIMESISTDYLHNLTKEELVQLFARCQMKPEIYTVPGRDTEQQKILFVLNHDLAQCKSKTDLALRYIAYFIIII